MSIHEQQQITQIAVLETIITVETRMMNLEAPGVTPQIQTPDGSIVTLVQDVNLVMEVVGCSLMNIKFPIVVDY